MLGLALPGGLASIKTSRPLVTLGDDWKAYYCQRRRRPLLNHSNRLLRPNVKPLRPYGSYRGSTTSR